MFKCPHFYFVELYEREANGMKVIYWDVAYPFPMSHRDVSFICGLGFA
jgi:hypothetical protein